MMAQALGGQPQRTFEKPRFAEKMHILPSLVYSKCRLHITSSASPQQLYGNLEFQLQVNEGVKDSLEKAKLPGKASTAIPVPSSEFSVRTV